jgi:cobyrinic acid a,c-diamide synthase
MTTSSPRLVIAGLSGDAGKTIATLSVLASLRSRGTPVSIFKKGPDYIDPAWLALVGQSVCRNLDTYMVTPDVVRRNFVARSSGSSISVIEGNRGLFDGRDVTGTHSTAELAKLLEAPVILVVDAAKTTRTVAALVKGCVDFDPEVEIAGVILNRVAGERHRRILIDSLSHYGAPEVLGAIPNLGDAAALIPGRHLGLVPPAEHEFSVDLLSKLRYVAKHYLDVDGILRIAGTARRISADELEEKPGSGSPVRIGYFRDSVFTFYYPENLEALEERGGSLVPISSLTDERLPEIDALYIGGGFPETHTRQLAQNQGMMTSVREAAFDGLPVYAECGGLIYLARSLRYEDAVYPMAGVFPIDLRMHAKPVGHGYTSIRVDTPNPFYAVGAVIRGHEFHYSGAGSDVKSLDSCMLVEVGTGVGGRRDGLVYKNTMACYTHVHADSVETWATSIISRAREYASMRSGQSLHGDQSIQKAV